MQDLAAESDAPAGSPDAHADDELEGLNAGHARRFAPHALEADPIDAP